MFISSIKKILKITDKKNLKILSIIFLLTFANMVIETIGIAMVIPLLSFFTDSNFLDNYEIVNNLVFKIFKNNDQSSYIYLTLIFFISLFVIKFLFVIIFNKIKFYFIYSVSTNLQYRLLKKYMFSNWEFLTNNNSALLIRNIQSEVGLMKGQVYQPIIDLFSEIILSLGIILLLILYEPKLSIILLVVFGVAGLLINFIFKQKLINLSIERLKYAGNAIKSLMEIFSTIREIKIYNKYNFFLNRYNYFNKFHAKIIKDVSNINLYPRNFLELISIIFLSVLIIVSIKIGVTFDKLLVIIGLYVASAYRLLPSLSKILQGIQNFRIGKKVLDNIYEQIQTKDTTEENNFYKSDEEIKFDKEIHLKNISFNYKKGSKKIITNTNFRINKNENIGLVGKSGEGKSTIIDFVLGLLTPTEGQFLVDGVEINSSSLNWRKKIGYVGQSINLLDENIYQNILFGNLNDEKNLEKVKNIINQCELSELENNLNLQKNQSLGEKASKLSGGEIQRIGIARALFNSPEILIMDEATNSLDKLTEKKILHMIYKLSQKITLIIISHDIENLSQCDKILELRNNKIQILQ
ncbi:ABC transporter ATP-binding protein/permease [Candidatus Pelagibacter ubique]|nr:ABC transporter ATP-binding protein/permease [Candidatus Pelagibacter ubique]